MTVDNFDLILKHILSRRNISSLWNNIKHKPPDNDTSSLVDLDLPSISLTTGSPPFSCCCGINIALASIWLFNSWKFRIARALSIDVHPFYSRHGLELAKSSYSLYTSLLRTITHPFSLFVLILNGRNGLFGRESESPEILHLIILGIPRKLLVFLFLVSLVSLNNLIGPRWFLRFIERSTVDYEFTQCYRQYGGLPLISITHLIHVQRYLWFEMNWMHDAQLL